MTARTTVTQAALTRALKAAVAAGLRVAAVRPDGTVIIASQDPLPDEITRPEAPLVKKPRIELA